MNPKDVVETTELDGDYIKELMVVKSESDFWGFIKRWQYWLDPDLFHTIGGAVCVKCASVLYDGLYLAIQIFKGAPIPVRNGSIPIKLLAPKRIRDVAVMRTVFNVPWGAAYLHMREQNIIDY